MRRLRLVVLIVLVCGLILPACGDDPCLRRVRLVTFGDSNTDIGFAGTSSLYVAVSYVSSLMPRPAADAPNSPFQLAGMVEAQWQLRRCEAIEAVNHGIAGSTTGGGGFGGPDRHPFGSPNPRFSVNGVTRFEAEVLGRGYPWSGGESGDHYPSGPIVRTRAFRPGPNDFAYVSLGTNDPGYGLTPAQTIENLRWMIEMWRATGLRGDHFIITTLAPSGGRPRPNAEIGALAAAEGVYLIDLGAYTSLNDSTWRVPGFTVDGGHYSQAVREWIASQVVAHMDALSGP